jgi:hypothetical protein
MAFGFPPETAFGFAGILKAFDIDVFQHVTEHIATKTISLPFVVR